MELRDIRDLLEVTWSLMSEQDMSNPVLWLPGLCSSHAQGPTALCWQPELLAAIISHGQVTPFLPPPQKGLSIKLGFSNDAYWLQS